MAFLGNHNMPIAILNTDGELQLTDIEKGCRDKKWIPLLVHRPRGEPDAIPTVILFETSEVARRFSLRNTPKGHLRGGVNLTPQDMEWIKKKGWKTEFIYWPKLMTNLPEVELGFEVLEFQQTPEVYRG